MTDRIYYRDPSAREFDATIVAATTFGGRAAVVLDRTAFYPTSGGQPFDTGLLNGVRVVGVEEAEDGTVLHLVERPLPPGPARGAIDWERRFDHMQQHTGQHVLSAAFDRVCQAATVSFHLGADRSTIDLAREVPPDRIAAAEVEANRVVWEDRAVTIRFATAEEAARLPLRKETRREGELRLVEVQDFDLSACGGTHVARTGAIGVIAVTGWERLRGGLRVEFVCGGRALAAFRSLRDAVGASVRVLSVHPFELAPAIERMHSDAKEQGRAVKKLQERLAAHEADALVAGAETVDATRLTPRATVKLVVAAPDGWDAGGLKALASAIASRPGHAAVLLGGAPSFPIVVARAADVSLDAAAALGAITARFGGKGGGRPDLAQGGGVVAPPDEVAALVRQEWRGRG
jgi:alanyl-tRNA synthetase